MRKRNVQILFRLNEEEAQYLYELVRKSGRSKEALLRSMVKQGVSKILTINLNDMAKELKIK